MTQQHPNDSLQADLEALAEVFEAEDREDRRAEAQRRRDSLPEPKRDIRTFPGFACPASSSWQDFLGFECRGGGVGQAQVHLLGPVP